MVMFQETEIMNEIRENGPVQGENISLRSLIHVSYANTCALSTAILPVKQQTTELLFTIINDRSPATPLID